VTAPAAPIEPAPGSAAGGSIYDLGYRGYDGPRYGRLVVTLGLLRQTLQEAYGIGRGGRAKIAPILLLILNTLPALLAVGITALVNQAGAAEAFEGGMPIRHDSYQSLTSTLVMLFCAAQAPELFGRDQRYGVLPLYFSRVLTRVDYALARTGGIFVAVLIITLVPQVVLSIGGILAASDPISGLRTDLPEVPKYLAVSLLASGMLAGIAAVIAASTPRRAYATATIIGAFILPPVIVGVVGALAVGDLARALHLLSPGDVIEGLNAAVFGVLAVASDAVMQAALPGWVYVATAVVVILGSLALVVRRYLTVTV
jgi:ABC-2 type transport system permease protein